MLKPELDYLELTEFLSNWAGSYIENLSQFPNGQVASVFAFDVPGHSELEGQNGEYVARFVSYENAEGLKKDRFIAPRAAEVGIPVPRQLEHGETRMKVANLSDDEKPNYDQASFPLAYAICVRAPGEHMEELQAPERRHLVPTTVAAIDTISTIDVSDTIRFGWFDGEGDGKHATWTDYIAANTFPHGGDNFYERRRKWFDEGFLEADVFQHFSDRMMELADFTPRDERSVVHMEFGYDNTLVVGNEVSAALDWDNSIIGDHVYDGAWNDLYMPEIDFKRLFTERYELTGRDVPNLDERWMYCQIHICIQALRWDGRSNNPSAYEWMKARTLHVLGEGPPVGWHPDS